MGTRTRVVTVGVALAVAVTLTTTFAAEGPPGEAADTTIRLRRPLPALTEEHGVYRRGLLLIDDPSVQRVLGPDGETLAVRVGLDHLLKRMPGEARRKDGPRTLRQMLAEIAVLRVPARVDPLELAVGIRRQRGDLEASPVHVIGFANHWRYSPGTTPEAWAGMILPAHLAAPKADAPTVAVIDTGLRPGRPTRSRASSALRGVRPLAGDDRESAGLDADLRGHGTFIASLIRQVDPRLRVAVGRLGELPGGVHLDGHDGGDIDAPVLSDELHLFAAVIRMRRYVIARDIDTAALNLSLGTPASIAGRRVNGDIDGLAVGVRAAIDHWRAPAGWPGRQAPPVIAAAGNHDGRIALEPAAPFVPGAYSDVYAVVAVDGDGSPASFSFLGWPDDLTMLKAPGDRIVGVRRVAGQHKAENQLWSWGGTSFATALVSAQAASTYPPASVETDAVGPPVGGPPPDVLVIRP